MKSRFLTILVIIFILGLGLLGCGQTYKQMGAGCENYHITSTGYKPPEYRTGERLQIAGIVFLVIAGGGTLALLIYSSRKKKSESSGDNEDIKDE